MQSQPWALAWSRGVGLISSFWMSLNHGPLLEVQEWVSFLLSEWVSTMGLCMKWRTGSHFFFLNESRPWAFAWSWGLGLISSFWMTPNCCEIFIFLGTRSVCCKIKLCCGHCVVQCCNVCWGLIQWKIRLLTNVYFS